MFDFCWWWRRAVSVCDHDRRGNNEIWSQVMITMWLRYEYNGVIWLNKTSIYFKIFLNIQLNIVTEFCVLQAMNLLHFILKIHVKIHLIQQLTTWGNDFTENWNVSDVVKVKIGDISENPLTRSPRWEYDEIWKLKCMNIQYHVLLC